MGKFLDSLKSGLGGALSGVAGGLLGSVGSKAVDSLFGSDPNKQNMKIMQMQNQFNASEAQKNRDFQLQMYNMTNAYNSPKQQIQRMMEAGLNPDLMYGGNGQSIAAQSPSGAQASGSSPIAAVDMQQRAANVALTQAQTRLIEHQADNIDADTGKLKADTQSTLTFNQFQPMLLSGQIKMNDVNIDLGKAKTDWTRTDEIKLFHQCAEISANIGVLNQTVAKLQSEIENIDVDTFYKGFRVYLESKQFEIDYREALSRIGLNNSQAWLNTQEAKAIAFDLTLRASAADQGVNPYIDEHNESVWRKYNLEWNGRQAKFNYGISKDWTEPQIKAHIDALKNGTVGNATDIIGALGQVALTYALLRGKGKPPKIGFR